MLLNTSLWNLFRQKPKSPCDITSDMNKQATRVHQSFATSHNSDQKITCQLNRVLWLFSILCFHVPILLSMMCLNKYVGERGQVCNRHVWGREEVTDRSSEPISRIRSWSLLLEMIFPLEVASTEPYCIVNTVHWKRNFCSPDSTSP